MLLDPTILRSHVCANRNAPPGPHGKRATDSEPSSAAEGTGDELGHYICDEMDEYSLPCDATFNSLRAYLMHLRKAHHYVDKIAKAVLTNQCFFCLSTFRSRAAAISHVKSVIGRDGQGGSGTCKCVRSIWSCAVVEPQVLSCPLCTEVVVAGDGLPCLQRHIASHFQQPQWVEVGEIPDGDLETGEHPPVRLVRPLSITGNKNSTANPGRQKGSGRRGSRRKRSERGTTDETSQILQGPSSLHA